MEKRVKDVNDNLTYLLYCNISTSLFEKDKLLFSFLLCTKILQERKELDPVEWRFFMVGKVEVIEDTGSTVDASRKKTVTRTFVNIPAPSWIPDKNWKECLELSKLPAFKEICVDITDNGASWKAYVDSSEPQLASLPNNGYLDWNSVTSFQKLLVLRCLRPDKVVAAIQLFINEVMGKKFIEPPVFDLPYIYKTLSTPASPLIFLLSSNVADPRAQVMELAEKMGFGEKKVVSVSLGQGQGVAAKNAIEEAIDIGKWVLLQNCHLAISWLPTLEKIVAQIAPERTHQDFRLWLTTMSTNTFPFKILQNGIKLTNEPPKGIRANLLRTYTGFDADFLTESKQPKVWRKLLFSLCFFHASIQGIFFLSWNCENFYLTIF